jgi:outer membrane receptor protein involved in Fe transport
VEAKGFSSYEAAWDLKESGSGLQITLRPAGTREQIVVSAARTEIGLSEAPGSSVLLTAEDVKAAPALSIDDMLRQVPGFSLFRRNGSRFGNPTTLGVSLRGLGASGASRALVMADEIPLLDPFGGWVYWDRIPREAIASAEVFRGGGSGLYGSNALGGVIQVFTRKPTGPAIKLETSYGNQQSPDFSVWAGEKIGRWEGHVESDLYRSDGYFLVPTDLRGAVDTRVHADHATVGAGTAYQWNANSRLFARGTFFADSRNNGTTVQTNDTRMGSGAAGIDTQLGTGGSLTVRGYLDTESYNQKFSAIASDRASEALTNMQHVPAQAQGGSAEWMRAFGKIQTILAGIDFRETIGASEEQIFSSGVQTFANVSGGRQRSLGFFVEDILRLSSRWTVIAAVRGDNWRNIEGVVSRTPIATPGPATVTNFSDRSENAFSPRLSVLRSLTSNLSLTASGYRAYRAPTLNELYRSFRQGNAVTNNNPDLQAEQLTGAEGGVNLKSLAGKIDLRGTYFWNQIVNPIANVTLSVTPTLITRQRQNLGRTQSQGVEVDGSVRVHPDLEISAGYSYTAATVLSFSANPVLVGLNVPQVPRHQFTFEGRYWNPRKLLLTVQGRMIGSQFDDDQNQLPLDRFFVMNVMAARNLRHGVEVFAAAENLFDQEFLVARTPVPNLGPPLLFRVGLRFEYPKR